VPGDLTNAGTNAPIQLLGFSMGVWIDSDGDGIPDSWEIAHGLNPYDLTDVNQPSTNPFAHGLTNLQVYQNPSVLIVDNYSTLGDGIADWWKVMNGLSLTDTNVASEASTLPWANGTNNLAAYQISLVQPPMLAAPAACVYTLAGTGTNFIASAGGGSVGLTAGVGCGWTATSSTNWVYTTSSGTGNGIVSYTFDANTTSLARSGTITVQGQTFTITQAAPTYTFTTFAGSPGASGTADGSGGQAHFYIPEGLTVDSAGNVYVADAYNQTIRKITPGGLVSTIAGLAGSKGSADGTGSVARFTFPSSVAVDTNGNVYVADSCNQTIRKITPSGTNWVVSTLAGLVGSAGTNDGPGRVARFAWPTGVAVDSSGNIYVADNQYSTVRKITPSATNWVVSTIAGKGESYGSTDGLGSVALFNHPQGVAMDSSGNVYVTDGWNSTIRKIAPSGTNLMVSTIAGQVGKSVEADGTGSAASFDFPFGMAVDSARNIYVADAYSSTIRKMTPSGTNWVVGTIAGLAGSNGSVDGTGTVARFFLPEGVAVDNAGNVYVADTQNDTIRKGVINSNVTSPDPTLVGWWELDEGTGTITADYSGYGHNGTLVGTPAPQWVAGLESNAVAFSGTGTDYVDIVGGGSFLGLTNQISISLWVSNGLSASGIVLSQYDTNSMADTFSLSVSNGFAQFELFIGGTSVVVTSATTLADNGWHYLAGTYDGTAMKVYVDGVNSSQSNATVSGTINIVLADVLLGRDGAGSPFAGAVDEVRLYNRALAANEIAALYNLDTDGDGIPNWWELANGLNPNDPSDASQSSTNPFAHGLTKLQVYQNPSVLIADNYSTLGDGISDWWKIKYGFSLIDPTVASAMNKNPFAHGLTNLQVYQNPSVLIADNYSTLGDGIPDWWKVKYGFSLTDPTVAGADPDGDGLTNLEEYQDGTDPSNASSSASAVLTIPNAWAVYNASNWVDVVAGIRSTNHYVTVQAAEVFVDVPGTNGQGIAMSAVDGKFDSTNETGKVTFMPGFPYSERHTLLIHARGGNDRQWCPYRTIIINPNVNDILDKIQTNYSAFADMQFNVTLVEKQNGVTVQTQTAIVKMKGPYKLRMVYDTGFIGIQNENQSWWHNDSLNIGGAMTAGLDGNFDSQASRYSDFFWDVPLSKSRTDASISNGVASTTFDCSLPAKDGMTWPSQHFGTDFRQGIVTVLDSKVGDMSVKSEYINPVELLPGHWLFTVHRNTKQFDSGESIVIETTINNVLVNQGLSDDLFAIPTEE